MVDGPQLPITLVSIALYYTYEEEHDKRRRRESRSVRRTLCSDTKSHIRGPLDTPFQIDMPGLNIADMSIFWLCTLASNASKTS
jgi:hypothetical protein